MQRWWWLTAALFISSGIFAQNNIELRSIVTYPQMLSDIWGYVDSSGNEYAIVGEESGVGIVDVTDPDSPTKLFYVKGDTSIWRDMKVWDDRAYVTNETGSGLMIIDLRNLPVSVSWKKLDGRHT